MTTEMSDADSPNERALNIPVRSTNKRRRYDSDASTPRYSSPDELQNELQRIHTDQRSTARRTSNPPHRDSNARRRAGNSDNIERSLSPDELDHTFFADADNRSNRSRRRSSTPRSRGSSIASDEGERISVSASPVVKVKPVRYREKLVLLGHQKGVSQVRFSPDGRWVASCSADATIKIWDAATGNLMQTLEGHLAGISTIAWSPDSNSIASGSDDKTIRLWDRATGTLYPNPLLGHHNFVYSIAFSPKGNMLVSGSYDEAIFLWDVRAGRQMRSLPAHSDPVGAVDFVRDGTLVVSCATDGLMYVGYLEPDDLKADFRETDMGYSNRTVFTDDCARRQRTGCQRTVLSKWKVSFGLDSRWLYSFVGLC
jgi:COMPASS component SWD3